MRRVNPFLPAASVSFLAAIAFGVLFPRVLPDSLVGVGIELPKLHPSSSPPTCLRASSDTLLLLFHVIGIGFALAGGFFLVWFIAGARQRAH